MIPMQSTACFFRPLYEVSTVINSSLNPQIVLQRVVEEAVKALGCKAGTLRLLDKDGQRLLASASCGLSKGYLRKGPIELLKSRVDTEVLSSGKLAYMKNVCADERFQYPEAAKEECLASILVAPLLVESKPVGVLRVYTDAEREFSRDEQDFLTAVAHLSAIAIENARLHEALKKDYDLLTRYNYQLFEE